MESQRRWCTSPKRLRSADVSQCVRTTNKKGKRDEAANGRNRLDEERHRNIVTGVFSAWRCAVGPLLGDKIGDVR